MGNVVYTLRDVVKTRSKGGASFTLRVPALDVHKGEFCSVVGPSGCGKSTLLDMLALVLEPSQVGQFRLNVPSLAGVQSCDVEGLPENTAARIRRHNIGYVLQSGGLLSFLTVRENIMLTAQISRLRVDTDDFEHLVETLGLGDQLEKKPQYLSGGQRQRVAVARALIHRPKIILADEPTAAVDYPTALDIRDELQSLARQMDAAVIMVTHDRSLVEEVADLQVHFALSRIKRNQIEATTSLTQREQAV
ncbi:ATP-binding cassette domain-containing protein [Desulfobulbus rhabdoformis]|uniref:ABC transporter ATP-binding protein n=1 Tax=Desulfobulbus rhabdoformis TaxID=34032 RepID=UPI0019647DF5|nr:ATP-binding cassette domain-containing protein [Desulfobulbus rhabdoformis]MBM9613295.1 ATP-binding cassette domain-containing protein [Desulfobulbus rhabdoformis]